MRRFAIIMLSVVVAITCVWPTAGTTAIYSDTGSSDGLIQRSQETISDNVFSTNNRDLMEKACSEYQLDVTQIGIIHDAACDGKTVVDVQISEDKLDAYEQIAYADNGCSIKNYISSAGEVTKLYLDYGNKLGYSVASVSKSTQVDAAIQGIIDGMPQGLNTMEKCLYIHDYLVFNCEYDYDRLMNGNMPNVSYTTEGCILEKKAVCAGYALAYNDIMEKLGIESYYVTSDVMNHAWNVIKLDGEYYHIDTTWDDPVYDQPGRVGHEYFLCSDNVISDSEHKHQDWSYSGVSTTINATSETYASAFFVDAVSTIAIDSNNYYYTTSSTKGIIKRSRSTNENSTICSFNDIWPVVNKPNYYYSGSFSTLVMQNNTLYYNTPTEVRSADINGNNVKTVYSYTEGDKYIYGVDDGKGSGSLYAYMNIAPYTSGSTVVNISTPSIDATDIIMSQNHADVKAGSTYEIGATIEPANSTETIAYSSSNTSIATVSDNGIVTGITPGHADITVKTSKINKTFGVDVYGEITSKQVSCSDKAVYSVAGAKPAVTVVDGITGKALTATSDYTIEYINNTTIGTATVKIKGYGLYKGEVECNFSVVPDVPNNVVIQDEDQLNMNVTWDAVEGASAYEIRYKATSEDDYTVVKVASPEKSIPVLHNGTKYKVSVRAITEKSSEVFYGDYSSEVEWVSAFVIADKIQLPDTSITLYVGQTYTITPTYEPVGVTENATFSSDSSVATVDNEGVVTAKSPGIANITVSTRNVSANVTMNIKNWNSKPTGFKAVLGPTYTKISAKWNKVSSADGYYLYYQKKGNTYWNKVETSDTNRTLSLSAGNGYNIKVKAFKVIGDKTYESSATSQYTIYTLKAPKVTLSKLSSKSIKVKWTNISGETGYKIYRASSVKGTYKLVKTSSYKYSSWTDKGSKSKGKYYYYKVRAYKYVDGKYIYGPYSSVHKIKY